MRFIKAKNYEEMSRLAGELMCAQVTMKPNCVLGLATGSTPVGMYAHMVKKYQAGEVDFSTVKTVNLDEYVGLDETNDQSYRYFMNVNLFDHVNIDKANTRVPNGLAADTAKEGLEYDAYIESLGGIDIQVLGIGLDGHIGFNEPDSVFTKATHEVALDPSTIEANARFFASPDEVPKTAISMGMGSIMAAKKILLIANGQKKCEIVDKALNGPIDPQVPASILQLHPDLTVIVCD